MIFLFWQYCQIQDSYTITTIHRGQTLCIGSFLNIELVVHRPLVCITLPDSYVLGDSYVWPYSKCQHTLHAIACYGSKLLVIGKRIYLNGAIIAIAVYYLTIPLKWQF